MAVPTVIMSVAAAESFINDIIHDAKYHLRTSSPHPVWCTHVKKSAKKAGPSPFAKYTEVFAALSGSRADITATPWGPFDKLVALRNAYAHQSVHIVTLPMKAGESYALSYKVVRDLIPHKIVKERSSSIDDGESLRIRYPDSYPAAVLIPGEATASSWLSALDNYSTAKWAFLAVVDVMSVICVAAKNVANPRCEATEIADHLSQFPEAIAHFESSAPPAAQADPSQPMYFKEMRVGGKAAREAPPATAPGVQP